LDFKNKIYEHVEGNKEVGMKFIREVGEIPHRDLKGAWMARDYNMTVRRSQEVVELVLKGVLVRVKSALETMEERNEY